MDYKTIFEQNLQTIKELLSIKSIYDETSVSIDAPYGKGVKDALLFMKNLAIKDGFIVKEYDNQVITISYVNKEDRIDIASHLDVVAVNNDWSFDPFTPFVKDNRLYGRGTSDMKVPAFLTYIGLKMLRDTCPNPKNEIRIVLGSDEERTMNDMRMYHSKVNEPLFAFSPDGIFPMGIGEKGALMWTLKGEYNGIIESLDGGVQCNVVPPICKIVLKDNSYTNKIEEYIKKNNIDGNVIDENNKTVLTVNGIAVHCSRCFMGRNAVIDALKIIRDVCKDSLSENLVSMFEGYYGEGIGIDLAGRYENYLTVNLGRLIIENNEIMAQVDARYPTSLTSKELTERVKQRCIVSASLDYDDPPTECSILDPYVKCLLDTYQDVTNDMSEPRIFGGVSYSKVFKHCVTFGPGNIYKPMMAHQKDEYIEIDDCITALEIYYKTMEKLANMEGK